MATNNNMNYNNPQFLAFMQMLQNGQINMPNPNNPNQIPNMNPNPNNNAFNNQNTVFIPPNPEQNQFNNNMFNNGVNMMNFSNFNPNAFQFNNNMNNNQSANINPNFQNKDQGDNWTLIFEKKPENSRLNIQISSSETVAKAFQKCREKLMLLDIPLTFTHNNGKQLDTKLTLSASGLKDGSVITVKVGNQNQQNQQITNNQNLNQNKFSNQMNNQGDPRQMNLFFQNQTENTNVSIQVKSDQLIKDAINAYKNKIQKNIEAIYIFNSKTLDENMSLKEANITSDALILVVPTQGLIGA